MCSHTCAHHARAQVYSPTATQEDVFRDTESLMTSVLDGYSTCTFAYGQSGTGKTHTMEGSDEMPGLVPRAMGRIFEEVEERLTNFSHECFLSMIEIYNETIRCIYISGIYQVICIFLSMIEIYTSRQSGAYIYQVYIR